MTVNRQNRRKEVSLIVGNLAAAIAGSNSALLGVDNCGGSVPESRPFILQAGLSRK
jgi:hypothetical protein